MSKRPLPGTDTLDDGLPFGPLVLFGVTGDLATRYLPGTLCHGEK